MQGLQASFDFLHAAVRDVDHQQDLALLDAFAKQRGAARLKAAAAQRYNSTKPADWRAPRPPLADTDPETWTNATIDEAMARDERFEQHLDAGAWSRVRAYVFELVKESRP